MSIFLPIISSIFQAGAFTLDKVVLSTKRVTWRTYLGVGFPLYWLVLFAIFLIVRPTLFPEQTTLLILLLLLHIILGLGNNILYYRALKSEELGELQTIDLLRGVPIIIATSFFFADERNIPVIIAALVATAAVIWSHWNRHHFSMKGKTKLYFMWSLIAAPIAATTSKILLASWNPISLWLVQDAVITVIAIALYRKEFKHTSARTAGMLLLIGALSATGWILFGYSYQKLGVVYTILIFSLHPLLVYVSSLVFLKEKFHWKKAVAFSIVLSAIAGAQVFG